MNNYLKIFQWMRFDIDEIMRIHEEIYFNHTHRFEKDSSLPSNDNGKIQCDFGYVQVPKEGRTIKKANRNILSVKYMFLCHLIISRCSGVKGGVATFNSVILEKVLGEYYDIMLETLKRCGFIGIGTYKVGVSSREIWLTDSSICKQETTNKKILKYRKKTKSLVKKLYRPLDESLSQSYSKALRKLTLDKDKAIEATRSKFFSVDSENDRKEYNWRIARIETFDYYPPKQDANGRIYHYLTNFPKDLVGYTNVHYELDCSNCHPMLLCFILMYYYKIHSTSSLYIYYLMDFLRKVLTDNEIKRLGQYSKDDIPEDVIRYIEKTSEGTFWDDYTERFGDANRSKVKQLMFSEVFYSYDNVVFYRDENVKDKYKVKYVKKYAREFRKDYPNVWSLIGRIKAIGKKRLVSDDDKKNSFFPCMMMSLEATIFRKILSRCYDAGYMNVINIHDAICVIDDDSQHYSPMEIKNIMLDVFSEYGLTPNIKIDNIVINNKYKR